MISDSLGARGLPAGERLVLLDHLLHLGLDLLEILGGQFVVEVDVVVEAGLRRRADVELGLGKRRSIAVASTCEQE